MTGENLVKHSPRYTGSLTSQSRMNTWSSKLATTGARIDALLPDQSPALAISAAIVRHESPLLLEASARAAKLSTRGKRPSRARTSHQAASAASASSGALAASADTDSPCSA